MVSYDLIREDRTPVLVGGGQLTQRDVDPAASRGPLEMMVETARRAAADAGVGPGLLRAVDSVAVVNVLTWEYGNAPRLLAERIGAHPTEEIYTRFGGDTPQRLVNETAAKIAAGRVRLALLAGGEALSTLAKASQARIELPWVSGGEGSPTVVGDARPALSEQEIAHGIEAPAHVYPLFETALRARYGRGVADHVSCLGVLCSRLSAVAASNPYAWFRHERTAAEVATPTSDNRIVGFPYTKYMNAVINVDQSAALLMASVAAARALAIPEDRWVYLWASAEATDRWFLSDRHHYHGSPAMRAAGGRALAAGGIDIGSVAYFDLYSCFPSALEIARDMLGIREDDPRALTVTGGLPYAGGPVNNYTMHAIVTMMEKLRAAPGTLGLITALGWYMTKHAIGIYSSAPPARPWHWTEAYDDAIHGTGRVPSLAVEANGRGVVETCTVVHDREGLPKLGIVIGRLDDGRRFIANTPEDRTAFEALMVDTAVGQRGRVAATDGVNRFSPE